MGAGSGRRFRREGTCVYLWLIHVDVWQKPTQYCKAIKKFKKQLKKAKTRAGQNSERSSGQVPCILG